MWDGFQSGAAFQARPVPPQTVSTRTLAYQPPAGLQTPQLVM